MTPKILIDHVASNPAPRIIGRQIVSPPDRVIQIERLIVSREHELAVTAAIRRGQRMADRE